MLHGVCVFKRLEVKKGACVGGVIWGQNACLDCWILGLSIVQLCESKSDSQIKSSNNMTALRVITINKEMWSNARFIVITSTNQGRQPVKQVHLSNKQDEKREGKHFTGVFLWIGRKVGDILKIWEEAA